MSGAYLSSATSSSTTSSSTASKKILSPEDARALLTKYVSSKIHNRYMDRKIQDGIQVAVSHINAMNQFQLPTFARSGQNSLMITSWELWTKDYRATIDPLIQQYANENQAGGEVQKLLEVSQKNWEHIYLKPRVSPKVEPWYMPEDKEPEDD
jgi:hypothetical protein